MVEGRCSRKALRHKARNGTLLTTGFEPETRSDTPEGLLRFGGEGKGAEATTSVPLSQKRKTENV